MLITDFSPTYRPFAITIPDLQPGRIVRWSYKWFSVQALYSSTVHIGCSWLLALHCSQRKRKTVHTYGTYFTLLGLWNAKWQVRTNWGTRQDRRRRIGDVYVTVLRMTLDTSPRHGHESLLSRTWCAVHLILINEGTKMCPPTRNWSVLTFAKSLSLSLVNVPPSLFVSRNFTHNI